MSRTALIAVLLTTATLVAPTHASAAGETATIVGQEETIVDGTTGRDVIVTTTPTRASPAGVTTWCASPAAR